MTVRRLLAMIAAAFGVCALAAAALVFSNRGTTSTQSVAALAAPTAEIVVATPSPEPIPTPVAEPTAAPTATPEPVPVEPAVMVQIPADLISTPTPTSPTSVPLPILTRIPAEPRDGSVVYLTFDDGPDPKYTGELLDLLAQFDAKATFFVIGNSVDAFPGTVQRIVAEGHALGNHTYRHEALPLLAPQDIVQTLSATNNAIARATGTTSSCVRPPYGSLNAASLEAIRAQGYAVSMWEVDSEDWRGGDSYSIAARVLRDTDLGSRVLFHDGPSNRAVTVAAVREVLTVLSNRGVSFAALPTC